MDKGTIRPWQLAIQLEGGERALYWNEAVEIRGWIFEKGDSSKQAITN
jgi:hypothetical protein